MKLLVLKYFVFLLPFFVFSQKTVLKGKIMDATTGAAIKNADIYFKNSSIGTVSNDTGTFFIASDTISKQDTLIVAAIGYKDYRIKVIDYLSLEKGMVFLQPNAIELSAVEVRPTTVKNILQKAIDQLDKNYFNTDVVYSGYLKQVNDENQQIKRLVYADVFLKFPPIKKKSKKIRFFLSNKQFKLQDSSHIATPDSGLAKISHAGTGLNLKRELTYSLTGLKYYNKTSVKKDTYGAYDIYRVVLEKRTENMKRNYIINIDQNTYAIISIEVNVDFDKYVGKWYTVLKNQEKKVSARPTYRLTKTSFRPFKDKWVLKEASGELIVNYKVTSGQSTTYFTNDNYLSIKINDFTQTTKLPTHSERLNLNRDIFFQVKNNVIPSRITPENFSLKELEFINKSREQKAKL